MRNIRINKERNIKLLSVLLLACAINLSGQEINQVMSEPPGRLNSFEAENLAMNETEFMASPDTNFTFEKYGAFLSKVSDTSKYIVLPIDEFRKRTDTSKIVIGLRHDVDNDLKVAYRFSKTEKDLGFRSTYYILHTADYYLASPQDKSIHTDSILPILRDMQDNSHFEIGWHNDLVTLQVVYHIDPVDFLHKELAWLRGNGIRITGSASHGSNFCKVYNYLNFYFFNECTWPVVGQFVNNIEIPDGSEKIQIRKGNFSDFGLEYEAYFLNNNKYFSDASIVNGVRWNIGMLDLNSLKKGDRVIILLHPIHWHQASVLADIRSFRIPGQKSGTIATSSSQVNIVMPYGTDLRKLSPQFTLSQGAYAKVLGSQQTSGYSVVNFSAPVTYRVYAENRSVIKDWVVNVSNAKNTLANFESFSFGNASKETSIDLLTRTIKVKVYSFADLRDLKAEFRLSGGANAYVESVTQVSGVTKNDFTSPVSYKVISEDGVTVANWKVVTETMNSQADFISFVLPGMSKPAEIDSVYKSINIEVIAGQPLENIPALFQVSAAASVYSEGIEQSSGLTMLDFRNPVLYDVISEDSLTINKWSVNVKVESLPSVPVNESPLMIIYPNPAKGKALIILRNLSLHKTVVGLYNSHGTKSFERTYENVTQVSDEIDLTGFTPGIYIVKCSQVKNPVRLIIF